MNKEIDLKKYLLFLSVFLLLLIVALFLIFSKSKPLCSKENNPCKKALCNQCTLKEDKEYCSDCNIFNEENDRVWTGSCIFEH